MVDGKWLMGSGKNLAHGVRGVFLGGLLMVDGERGEFDRGLSRTFVLKNGGNLAHGFHGFCLGQSDGGFR